MLEMKVNDQNVRECERQRWSMGGYLFSYISKQSHKAMEFSLKENHRDK